MVLEVAGDRLIEPVLLGVEPRAQFDGHEEPQTVDAPLPLHGEGDLIDVLDHGLDPMLHQLTGWVLDAARGRCRGHHESPARRERRASAAHKGVWGFLFSAKLRLDFNDLAGLLRLLRQLFSAI